MNRYIVFLLLIISLYACNSVSEKQANEILNTLEDKDERFQNIASDTLIFEARNFFIAHSDRQKAALASFYCGRIYQEQDRYDQAMSAYMDAENRAKQVKDYDLLGSIYFFTGKMYYKQLLPNECINKMRLSLAITQQYSNNYGREIAIYSTMGNCYLIENEMDSCYYYYDQAIQLAKVHNDTNYISSGYENMSIFYQKMNNIKTAKKYLQESIALNTNKSSRMYFNLANLFNQELEKDSLIYYTKIALTLAEKVHNNLHISNAYQLLSQIEMNAGNYKQAMIYKDRYIHYVLEDRKEQSKNDVLEIEKKYNYEQTENQNKQLLIERQFILIGIFTAGLLITVIYFYVYGKMSKQRIHSLTVEKSSLETEQQARSLLSMADSYDANEQSLRTAVLSHFDILKKVALLKRDDQLNERTDNYTKSPLERINYIIYGVNKGHDYDWDAFFDSVSTNALYKDIIVNINESYPGLDNFERNICYFTCMDFSNSEISTLLGQSLRTVENYKTTIRRKLNISDKMNMKEYLTAN